MFPAHHCVKKMKIDLSLKISRSESCSPSVEIVCLRARFVCARHGINQRAIVVMRANAIGDNDRGFQWNKANYNAI
jgi:hypothetical protein